MEMLAWTYTLGLIIALGFIAWLHTKPGKKWLEGSE